MIPQRREASQGETVRPQSHPGPSPTFAVWVLIVGTFAVAAAILYTATRMFDLSNRAAGPLGALLFVACITVMACAGSDDTERPTS